ncbi:MAG: 3-deoxy-D-manno-octulosonic acid transferase [Comamonadaceae bacterium]|nr:3-deoxy-D-manno-octulosonic acid transferase [Comamonadaceae bacterium]
MPSHAPSASAPSRPFPPTWRLAAMIGVYELLWHLLLPVLLLFLWQRGRKEPLYRQFWSERFGVVNTTLQQPLWVHSASMGEFRGAAPLVSALLAADHRVIVTTLTPAGRCAAQKLLAREIADGRAEVVWVPLELGWAVRGFIRRVRPRAALMTEIDTWPVLVATIRRQGVPLGIANAQYPAQSLTRDRKWCGFRASLFQAYQLVLCKSETHAKRFRDVGCERVVIAGETRFDLPVAPQQIAAAQALVARWKIAPDQRPVVGFASTIVGEDEPCVQAFALVQAGLAQAGLPRPLFVYVPRSPQRFDAVAQLMEAGGLRVARRSRMLDAALAPTADAPDMATVDVLLGDSLGEMYFYLALSQAVVVGGSFVDSGAHNVIEPLALKKPVLVGPSIWGIEYPGVEALAAGVLQQHMSIASLSQALVHLLTDPKAYANAIAGAEAFYAEHGGATVKHMAALQPWLEGR